MMGSVSVRFRNLVAVLGFVLVAACGGGGGSYGGAGSPPGSNSSATSVSVAPGLGAFGAGAVVEVFNATDGTQIGNASTTDATGRATIDLGAYSGPFVIRVSGVGDPAVPSSLTMTYYDEAVPESPQSFSQNDFLLAMVPASSAVTVGTSIGVTPLTHMAAAFAGLTRSSLQVLPTNDVEGSMLDAYARVRLLLGLGLQSNTSVAAVFNPLVAPTLLSSTQTTIDLSSAGGTMGLLLAEIATATRGNSTFAALTPANFAQVLFSAAADLRQANFNASSESVFANSPEYAVLNTATAAVGTGTSIFLGCLPEPGTKLAINTAMAGGVSALDISPADALRNQLKLEIETVMATQLSAVAQNLIKDTSVAACQ